MKAFTRLQLATLVAKGWVPEIVACHSVSVKGPQVKSKISVGFDRYAVHAYTACWRSGILRLSWAVDDITGHSQAEPSGGRYDQSKTPAGLQLCEQRS